MSHKIVEGTKTRVSKERCQCGNLKSQKSITCWDCVKRRKTINCVICDESFSIKASINRKTCSRACAYRLRGKINSTLKSRKIIITCIECTKEIKVHPCKANRKFCSYTCSSAHNKGANHPSWQGGISPEKNRFGATTEWRNARKIVWKRDNATCQRCKERFNHTSVPYEVHHIKPFRFVDTRLTIDNLILLCDPCHIWVHSNANKDKMFINT